jgi:O-antigen ligase
MRLESASIWGNSNDLAALICLILPFSAEIIYKKSATRFLRYILLAFILISLWLTQSRGAFLALIFGATVVFFISYDSKRWLKIIGLVALTPLIAYLLIFRSESDLADSSSARKNYIIAGVSMFSTSPIYGVGAGNYPNLYEYHTPEFYEWGQRNAHSTWIIPLAEGGLIGFLVFLFLYLDIFQRLIKIIKVDQGLTMSFVAYSVAMSFLSHTYSLLPYLIFSIVIIKFRLHQQVYS